MDHLLLLLLLWSSGLWAGGNHNSTGVQCVTRDKVDIVLLVAETQSMKDFETIRSFVSDVVRMFDIGPDRFQFGLTWYSRKLNTEWHLNTHQTKRSLLSATANLTYREGADTRTGATPYKMNHELFKPHVGMRRESQKVAVLITDAGSWNNVDSPLQTLKDDGIEIHIIGVKDADVSQLRTVASDPKESHVYYVKDLSFLPDIVTNLTVNLCESTNSLESVRLVNGTSLCSGRLEVKSNHSNQSNQWWSSVCEDDFDQQDAEVVCRELGCGPPLVLQGGLYGSGEAPMWTKEFQCEGRESSLLGCRSSGSARTTCSPGKAAGLTCSEPVRLVGGTNRCSGKLQVKLGEWRPVDESEWTLKAAAVACRELDCGSAVSTERRNEFSERAVRINHGCLQSGFTLRECSSSSLEYFPMTVELTCSESVRLVNGTSLCSGRLEVKSDHLHQSNQPNQWWSSVDETDFDQQDAEVVCKEIGCGPPLVLQGGLYGAGEAPMWTREFQCGGHESALLDCRSSGSARTTCSPRKAVGLTCSEPVRLVGGASRCAGTLQVKLGEWRPVGSIHLTLKAAAEACRDLDCGSAVSTGHRVESELSVWISSDCIQSGFTLRECSSSDSSYFILGLTCLESVRLVNGTSLCSGRLEVKSNHSNQSNMSSQWWSSVCEDDFDEQDAEVVCRELGCGPPLVLQGGLYGSGEAPKWTKEFHCGGHESALLDCRSSGSARTTCSPGKTVGLTCSEPVRLVGGASRCAGTLQVKLGEWSPVDSIYSEFTLKEADVACRELDCGFAVSTTRREQYAERSVWISTNCVQSGSSLRECSVSGSSPSTVEVTCSDLLVRPIITVSSTMDTVSGTQQQDNSDVFLGWNFTISCSIQPQYPGGVFQLTFTSSRTMHRYIQSAVNHSTTFLFPAAEPAHQGSYSCVYQVYVSSHNFSSMSRGVSVTVSDPTSTIIRMVILLLSLQLMIAVTCLGHKAARKQKPGPQHTAPLL